MRDPSPRLRTLEPDDNSSLYKTLLESTLAIPFRIDWATKRYTYIGPRLATCWAGHRKAG